MNEKHKSTPETCARMLLSEMTLDQKIAQLQCVMVLGEQFPTQMCQHGIGELSFVQDGRVTEAAEAVLAQEPHIPPFIHTETLTGVQVTRGTVFPTALGLGATFDPELVEEAASLIHDQTRAIGFNQSLAPVLDVCRDPRWGRVGETYGEDPTLNALIGTAYVKGLQGTEEKGIVAATGKHFLGYGTSSGGLNMATNPISMREVREVYAKPFQAAVTEAGLMSIMNSYGTIDGEMVIGSRHILTDLLRKEMEFDGFVVSDYGSVEHLVDHKLASDLKDAGVQSLEAGLDVECPMPVGYSAEYLKAALAEGRLSMETIDEAVLRVLTGKYRAGLFQHCGPDERYEHTLGSDGALALSKKAAQKATVLLKNNGILPLKKEKQKIAVVGPHADSVRYLFGCYTFAAGIDMMLGGSFADQAGMSIADMSDAMKVKKDTPLYPNSTVEKDNLAAIAAVEQAYGRTPKIIDCIKAKAPESEVTYVRGCDIAGDDRSGFQAAVEAAQQADVVIFTAGGKYGWGGSCTVGEGVDTDHVGLTGVQEELALALMETGTPVIVVHMDARPFSSVPIAERAAAILEYWFPGSSGGMALADVLFGDYNPAGRLSMTALRHVGQVPLYHSQPLGNGYYGGRCATNSARYVDSTTEPLYHFGHGLSYTKFSYSDLTVTPSVAGDGEVDITCKVQNIGDMAGEEVVQLYVSDELASMLRPAQEFAGCARVMLQPKEEKTIRFTCRADQFAFVGRDGRWLVEAGQMSVRVGGCSNKAELEGMFEITDTRPVRPAKRGFFASVQVM